MNELQNHIRCAIANPTDFTLRCALRDHMEETNYPDRVKVAREIVKARRAGRRAREMVCAVALLAEDSPVQPLMLNAILFAVGFGFGARATVIVVEGRGRPQVRRRTELAGWVPRDTNAITVPARWILDTERIISQPVAPPLTIPAGGWPKD